VGTPSLVAMREMLDAIVRSEPTLDTRPMRGGPSVEDLKTLLEIAQAVNATSDLDQILEMVMTYAIKLVAAERGFIMLVENGELVIRRSHNLAPEQFGSDSDRFSQTIANRVLQTGQSIYTSDAQDDERFVERQSVHDLHLRSIMGVPLKHNDEVIGVVYLDNSSQARLFLQSDLYILELLAQQASIALANAQHLRDIRGLQRYAENIVASTPAALLVLSPSSQVMRHNERGALLLSAFSPDVRDNVAWLDVVPAEEREAWSTLFRGVLQTGRPNSWARHKIQGGSDARIYRVNVSPLRSGENRAVGLVLTLDDITDSERMREELLRAEVSIRKSDEISNVAHEMNNLLNVVSNQAEVNAMSFRMGDTGKIAAGVPRTLEAISKLTRLVQSLQLPDRMDPKPHDFAVSTVVESLAVWLHAEKRFDLVELDINVPANLPFVRFDPLHFEMALYNLCKNAAEAMAEANAEHRVVAIEARTEAGFVVVSVQDTGPGLPAQREADPWEVGGTTKETGHGRGLANTRTFIEKNSGRIEAEAHSARGGAGFTLYLPMAVS
jgi:signal transduction histidine kinase